MKFSNTLFYILCALIFVLFGVVFFDYYTSLQLTKTSPTSYNEIHTGASILLLICYTIFVAILFKHFKLYFWSIFNAIVFAIYFVYYTIMINSVHYGTNLLSLDLKVTYFNIIFWGIVFLYLATLFVLITKKD